MDIQEGVAVAARPVLVRRGDAQRPGLGNESVSPTRAICSRRRPERSGESAASAPRTPAVYGDRSAAPCTCQSAGDTLTSASSSGSALGCLQRQPLAATIGGVARRGRIFWNQQKPSAAPSLAHPVEATILDCTRTVPIEVSVFGRSLAGHNREYVIAHLIDQVLDRAGSNSSIPPFHTVLGDKKDANGEQLGAPNRGRLHGCLERSGQIHNCGNRQLCRE